MDKCFGWLNVSTMEGALWKTSCWYCCCSSSIPADMGNDSFMICFCLVWSMFFFHSNGCLFCSLCPYLPPLVISFNTGPMKSQLTYLYFGCYFQWLDVAFLVTSGYGVLFSSMPVNNSGCKASHPVIIRERGCKMMLIVNTSNNSFCVHYLYWALIIIH